MSDSASPMIPSADAYASALKQLEGTSKLSKSAGLMLKCHYQAPDRTVTYGQLAKAAGLSEANLVYGKFCRTLGEALNFPFRMSSRRDERYYGSVIGHDIPATSTQDFQLRMYPEVVSALEMLGWYQSDMLDDLRPTSKSAVIDLVAEADISVDDWNVTESGEPVSFPRSNPRYCYNWSFGSAREGFLLCVWHQSLKTSAGNIVFDENLLEHGRHKQQVARTHPDRKIRDRAQAHARRSFAFYEACHVSYLRGLPLRVILNEGSRRDRENLDESSEVALRELDPERWFVQRFDENTGDCLIVRGISPVGIDVEEADGVSPDHDEDSPDADDKRRWAEIRVRQKQGPFRDMLLNAYGRKCAVTGTRIVEILEAAHIIPHAEETNYRAENGVLLRADIHTLFDLYLLSVDERCRVHVSRTLRHTDYAHLNGRTMHLPALTYAPSALALKRRHERFLEKEMKRP